MILPRGVPNTRVPSTKRDFMELKKQELLKRFTDPAEKERGSMCVTCRDNNTKAFLFPTCRIVHSFACEGCIPEILKDVWSACRFPSCINDNLLREEFGKTVEQHRREWVENGGTVLVQPQAIDLLTLAIPGRWPNSVLLHSETTVTLKNIALSDLLLSKLLEKTKVVVGENVSVFGNFKGENCIRKGTDFEGLCLLRPASFSRIENNTRFMENIAEIPNNRIKLGKVNSLVLWNYAINILPKLILHEENVMGNLTLDIYEKNTFLEYYARKTTSGLGR
ncbi:MAG: uncharacterized protein A8A55_2799 [Amphiamblys sp. WSBS2006]|nr:MAG: uncharacterized protein A8A55_2799 [Amphiamblys sp. WSBS2006]